jgi:hypothetical protein
MFNDRRPTINHNKRLLAETDPHDVHDLRGATLDNLQNGRNGLLGRLARGVNRGVSDLAETNSATNTIGRCSRVGDPEVALEECSRG